MKKNINYKQKVDIGMVEKNIVLDEQKFILDCEQIYEKQLKEVAEYILDKKNKQIIFLAGPSSSGKTTTAHKIAGNLKLQGKNSYIVSLDDFYIDNDKQPRLPDGSFDYETINALDLKKLDECLKEIVEKGESEIPVFDFKLKKRVEQTRTVTLKDENTYIIIEGIHALNEQIVHMIGADKFIKIFITVRSTYVDDGKTVIEPNFIRLLRRMTRDMRYRNTNPVETFSMWSSVRKGEVKYILPFKDDADIKIDSLFKYEVCLYYNKLKDDLDIEKLDKNLSHYKNFAKTIEIIQKLPNLSSYNIPKTSLLREFVGE